MNKQLIEKIVAVRDELKNLEEKDATAWKARRKIDAALEILQAPEPKAEEKPATAVAPAEAKAK